MDMERMMEDLSVWNLVKMIVIAISFVPNFTLVVKILSRPSIHTIFNISLATLFGIIAIFGPLLCFFYFEVFEQQYGLNDAKKQERKQDCARLIEFRNAIGESLRIISVNLMFRYFFVVHADKGLSVHGESNTTLLKWIYVAFTLGSNSVLEAPC